MRKGLVIFSPLPPVQNGIADYAIRLIAHHANAYDCLVVIANHAPDPVGLPLEVSVLRDEDYRSVAPTLRGLTHLFHVGNNPDHIYMLDHLEAVSGIVVLHDLTLHHLLSEAGFEGVADRKPFERWIWREHGAAGQLIAEQAQRLNWRSAANFFELPVLGAALRNASAVIVHSWMGVLRAQSCRPGVPVRRIEHYADVPKAGRTARRSAARARLGLPQDADLLLSLGFVTPAKQLDAVMDAIRLIETEAPHLFYVVVGAERGICISAEAERRGIARRVVQIGYASEEELSDYLDAANILVNLRYPTGGETSGSLSRALGRGVCSVVSDHGWYAELPDDVVVKTPACANPTSTLAGTLLKLIKDYRRRLSFEAAAATWAAGRVDLETVVMDYHSVIDAATPRPVSKASRSPALLPTPLSIADANAIASDHLIALEDASSPQFAGRLWWSEGFLPIPAPGGVRRLSGPLSLRSLIRRLARCEDFGVPGQAADCGVFVGSWAESSKDGARLAEFCHGFAEDGVAAFAFWSLEAGGDDAMTAERATRLLADFDFEVLRLITKSATPLAAVLRGPPATEIAALARRAVGSSLANACSAATR